MNKEIPTRGNFGLRLGDDIAFEDSKGNFQYGVYSQNLGYNQSAVKMKVGNDWKFYMVETRKIIKSVNVEYRKNSK